jgi:hypothetical protein
LHSVIHTLWSVEDESVILPLPTLILVSSALDVAGGLKLCHGCPDGIYSFAFDTGEVSCGGSPVVRLGQDEDEDCCGLKGQTRILNDLVTDLSPV